MSFVSGTTSSASSYLRELQQELEAELKRSRQNADGEEARADDKVAEMKKKLEDENRRTVEAMRKNQEESSTRERENHRTELKRLQQTGYDRTGRNRGDLGAERSRMAEQVRKVNQEARDRVLRAEDSAEARTTAAFQASKEREEASTRTLQGSHAAESAELRESVRKALDLEKQYQGDRADGRRQGYAEIEEKFLEDRRILEKQFRDELEGVREKTLRKEQSDSVRQSALAADRDTATAERFREREAEHQAAQKDLKRQYDDSLAQIENKESGDLNVLERELGRQRQELAGQFERAHKTQAENYEGRLKVNQERSTEEIQDLNRQLLEAKGMPDPRKVAPVAYERIREAATRQIEQSIGQREARYRENLDALKQRTEQNYLDQEQQHSREVSRLSRDKTQSELQAQARVSLVATESEARIASTRLEKEQELARSLGTSNKMHSREIEVLRRKYEDMLEGIKNDAADKILLLREQYDFENRMTRRAFSAQQNELIRDYEKRLDDAKAESVELGKRTQEDAQKVLRDLEDKHREELDKTNALSSRRIVQLEQQYQNRERVMARNYQEEIEKLKRANAQLVSKKS